MNEFKLIQSSNVEDFNLMVNLWIEYVQNKPDNDNMRYEIGFNSIAINNELVHIAMCSLLEDE